MSESSLEHLTKTCKKPQIVLVGICYLGSICLWLKSINGVNIRNMIRQLEIKTCNMRVVIFELYSLQLTLVTELCVWMHSLTRSFHYAQGRPCLYVFVHGALWFHGSITVIDRRWFTDNPWLRSHIGPHEERHWLWASCVLESELHVALDSHLFLCIRPLTLCPFFLSSLLYLKSL